MRMAVITSTFCLIHVLTDLLKKAAKARIINVSSRCHLLNDVFDVDNLNFKMDDSRGGFYDIYNTSKLCNVLFTKELAKRLADSGKNKFFRDKSVCLINFHNSIKFIIRIQHHSECTASGCCGYRVYG